MTRPDYRGWLTDDDLERLAKVLQNSQHVCPFNDEERQIIKDMASGGKLFKKAILYILVAAALWLLIIENGAKKVVSVLGWIK